MRLPDRLKPAELEAIEAGATAYVDYVVWFYYHRGGNRKFPGATADAAVEAAGFTQSEHGKIWHEVMSFVVDVARERIEAIPNSPRCKQCGCSLLPYPRAKDFCSPTCGNRHSGRLRVIENRTTKILAGREDEVRRLYLSGKSYPEIGSILGCHRDTVGKMVRALGINRKKGARGGDIKIKIGRAFDEAMRGDDYLPGRDALAIAQGLYK